MLTGPGLPIRMSFERHSSLTDFTQRSANEVQSGLRAGNLTGTTLTACAFYLFIARSILLT